MPLHVQPILRAREEALETEGLIKKINSAGFLTLKSDEDLNKRKKVVPVQYAQVIRGTKYTAS